MRTPLLSPSRRTRPRAEPGARSRQGDNLLGAGIMVASMAAFTLNDAAIKHVTQTLPLSQSVALRGVLVSAALWLLAQRDGGVVWWPAARRDRWMLTGRNLAEGASTLLYLLALQHMALGDLSAIMQSLPLAVMLAAAVVFRERMGWRRLLAVGVGFAGVMLILRPGTASFTVWSALALATVALIVVRDLTTRAFSPAMRSGTVALHAALTVTVCAPFMPSDGAWRWPTGGEALGLVASAACLSLGYLTAVGSMRVGEIGFVSPFRYTSLIFAVALGFAVFGEWPDPWTWAGAGLIVAAGLYSIWRETRLRDGGR